MAIFKIYMLALKKDKTFSTEDMGSGTWKGNDIAWFMHKDELAFLHTHHRSYISKSHLSEAERSWNHHHGPVLPNINTRERGSKGGREGGRVTVMQQLQHAPFSASSHCCLYEEHLYLRLLIARDVFLPLISMHCEIKIHPSSCYRLMPENEVKMKRMNSSSWGSSKCPTKHQLPPDLHFSLYPKIWFTIHKQFKCVLISCAICFVI